MMMMMRRRRRMRMMVRWGEDNDDDDDHGMMVMMMVVMMMMMEVMVRMTMIGTEPRTILCASLHSRNACQAFTRATWYGNLQEKCCRPKLRRRLCASLRRRNACQDFTTPTFYGNLQVNVLDPISLLGSKMPQAKTALQTLCEPAQSKRMSRFHKSHFIRKFTGKMQQPRVSTLINYRPLHLP